MKTVVASVLYLSACSAAVVQQRQPQVSSTAQGTGATPPKGLPGIFGLLSSLGGAAPSSVKFAGKEVLKPQFRANAKREKVRWGPYILAAKGVSIQMSAKWGFVDSI
jgi:hypothetical protein